MLVRGSAIKVARRRAAHGGVPRAVRPNDPRNERFRAISQGRKHDMESDNYLDEIHAFFQNCYHLKDWIKNDPAVAQTARDAVETFINGSRPLRLCADICNAQKHFKLTTPRSAEAPKFGKKLFKVGLGNAQPTTIALEWTIEAGSGAVEAFDLATQCLTEWKNYLRTHKLL
jgi:hypothetical protein